jgi:acyl carrier protein
MNGGTSLDDFATLRAIRDFMTKRLNGASAKTASETHAAQQQPDKRIKSVESESPCVSTDELNDYLINFVVEQTGYPEDMVDLDADLEGDLGIDSIKKAQLLGELNEMFHFSTAEDMNGGTSLDDFATLRAIRDFMTKRLEGVSSKTVFSSDQKVTFPNGEKCREIYEHLKNFIVEQTGFPSDMIDFDVDLETDLGVESVKKAQLFGELAEIYSVFPLADRSLDDFNTLRQIYEAAIKELF